MCELSHFELLDKTDLTGSLRHLTVLDLFAKFEDFAAMVNRDPDNRLLNLFLRHVGGTQVRKLMM